MTRQAEDLHLRPWQEIIGKCIETSTEGDNTIILIETQPKAHRFKLSLPGFIEGSSNLLGQVIGVIKTDDIKRPFIIRKITTPTAKTTANTAASTTTTDTTTTVTAPERAEDLI